MTKRIFVSASPEDLELQREIERQLVPLERQGALEFLSVDRAPGGSDIGAWLRQALQQADLALLMLSPAFFANDHVQEELSGLFKRQSQGLRIIPVLLRPCDWRSDPRLAVLKVLPQDSRALTQLGAAERDSALIKIKIEIQLAINSDSKPPTASHGGRRNAGSGSDSTSRPPHWGLFGMLCALLLILVGISIVYGPQLLHGQSAVVMVLSLALFSLLAAAVLSGLLGASGKWQPTPGVALGGAAAIFAATFGILAGATDKLTPTEWVARGIVTNLPGGRTAWIGSAGCSDVQINSLTGRFELPIHGPCDRAELHLDVRVLNEVQRFKVARADAQNQEPSLDWKASLPEVTDLSGIVLDANKRPIRGASVKFESPCQDALRVLPATTSADGSFRLDRIPYECRRPPYLLRVYLEDGSGRAEPFKVEQAWGNVLQIPSSPSMTEGPVGPSSGSGSGINATGQPGGRQAPSSPNGPVTSNPGPAPKAGSPSPATVSSPPAPVQVSVPASEQKDRTEEYFKHIVYHCKGSLIGTKRANFWSKIVSEAGDDKSPTYNRNVFNLCKKRLLETKDPNDASLWLGIVTSALNWLDEDAGPATSSNQAFINAYRHHCEVVLTDNAVPPERQQWWNRIYAEAQRTLSTSSDHSTLHLNREISKLCETELHVPSETNRDKYVLWMLVVAAARRESTPGVDPELTEVVERKR